MNSEDKERFEQQRDYYQRALARLGEVLLVDETEIVRDAIIQRFEFTFEMAWKTLFRFLTGQGERVAEKAWAVLPEAFQSQLIEDAETWVRMRELRNQTSHEYDQQKAIDVVAFMRQQAYPAMVALRDEMARRR